jgi:hypothetical protein
MRKKEKERSLPQAKNKKKNKEHGLAKIFFKIAQTQYQATHCNSSCFKMWSV